MYSEQGLWELEFFYGDTRVWICLKSKTLNIRGSSAYLQVNNFQSIVDDLKEQYLIVEHEITRFENGL